MELAIEQQFFDQVERARSVAIALPQRLSVDALATGTALSLFLRKLGKQVVMASSGSLPAVSLGFLPVQPALASTLTTTQNLVVTLRTADHQLDELSYVAEPERVNIFLKAKSGAFSPEDITVSTGGSDIDLIIVLGAGSPETLGKLYQDNAELFFSVPKINIDYAADNEYFGTINIVDVTASSLGEIVAELLEKRGEGTDIDADIATSLLGGIISRTHSFQQPQTTPRTLTVAADLVQRGARQQDIIVHLYKTKDFQLLKLWGRALARLKTVDEYSLMYTSLNANDFARTQTGADQILSVLREFIDNMSGFQIIAIVSEVTEGQVRLVVAAPPHVPLATIAERLGAPGKGPEPIRGVHGYISIELPNTALATAETSLLEAVATLPTRSPAA